MLLDVEQNFAIAQLLAVQNTPLKCRLRAKIPTGEVFCTTEGSETGAFRVVEVQEVFCTAQGELVRAIAEVTF